MTWQSKHEISLDNQGLIFLHGRNGAGKSTIWNLLNHLVYENTPIKARKDDLMEEGSSDFVLSLSAERDGVPYQFDQYRKLKTPIERAGRSLKGTGFYAERRIVPSLGGDD